MTHDHHPTDVPLAAALDCDALERRISDYLDGDLSPAGRAAVERHLAGCASCRALHAALDDVRTAALHLPELQPARDLWAGVERRIAAPVVELQPPGPRAAGPGPEPHVATRPPNWYRRPWLAAAAVLLVAGGLVVFRTLGPSDAPGAPPTAPHTIAAATVGAPAVPTEGPRVEVAEQVEERTTSPRPAARGPRPAPGAPDAALLSTYRAELAALERAIARRRAGLDTGTVRVLEANLAIIDEAISESRAALATEPASQLLHQQLNTALGNKLELMRTAVLLSGDD